VNGQRYQRALTEVTAAATAYHGGVTDQHASLAINQDGRSVWAPIYSDLLAELAAALRSAGQRYDRAADQVDVPVEQRFDWRSYLGPAESEDEDEA
jgi:hypothetical protein